MNLLTLPTSAPAEREVAELQRVLISELPGAHRVEQRLPHRARLEHVQALHHHIQPCHRLVDLTHCTQVLDVSHTLLLTWCDSNTVSLVTCFCCNCRLTCSWTMEFRVTVKFRLWMNGIKTWNWWEVSSLSRLHKKWFQLDPNPNFYCSATSLPATGTVLEKWGY